jgi:hypothetical protein
MTVNVVRVMTRCSPVGLRGHNPGHHDMKSRVICTFGSLGLPNI